MRLLSEDKRGKRRKTNQHSTSMPCSACHSALCRLVEACSDLDTRQVLIMVLAPPSRWAEWQSRAKGSSATAAAPRHNMLFRLQSDMYADTRTNNRVQPNKVEPGNRWEMYEENEAEWEKMEKHIEVGQVGKEKWNYKQDETQPWFQQRKRKAFSKRDKYWYMETLLPECKYLKYNISVRVHIFCLNAKNRYLKWIYRLMAF